MKERRQQDIWDIRTGQVHASVFGVFRLKDRNGQEITIANRRARGILAMLCLVPDEPLERAFISRLLWPGRFEAQAKASLRQCLLELGKLLSSFDNKLLVVTRTHVSLGGTAIPTDLFCLEHALVQGNYSQYFQQLTAISTNPLLDQLNFGEAFEQWLSCQRIRTEQRLKTAVLTKLATLQGNANTLDYGLLLNAWLQREPDFELAANNSHNQHTKIAVLAFSGMEQQDYFADGVVDEIITMLGQVPSIKVAGRSSSFGVKDSQGSLPEIAQILGVAYLVEGSVQRQGNAVRINVRLLEGKSGFEVWGNRYTGTVDDIFTLQERVAGAVTIGLSAALGLTLSAPKMNEITHNQQAYDLYMQGRALSRRIVGEGVLETAIALLEQAVKLDPQFAQCWTALAEANAYVTVFTPHPDKLPFVTRMAECASKAMELSPTDGHALVMLGVYHWTHNNPLAALDLAFKAYRLEPNNSEVLARLGSFLAYCGLTQQAMPYITAAAEQDPLNGRHLVHLSSALLNLGDLVAARRIGEKIVAVGFPSLWLAVASAAMGESELAVKQYSQTRLMMNAVMTVPTGTKPMSEQELDAYWQTVSKGICSGQEQDRLKYCQVLEIMYASLPDQSDVAIVLPAIWMGHGQMVFKTVGQQVTPASMSCLISLWADIEPIRQVRLDPDFMPFAAKIGLVEVWEKYGWPDLLPKPNTDN